MSLVNKSYSDPVWTRLFSCVWEMTGNEEFRFRVPRASSKVTVMCQALDTSPPLTASCTVTPHWRSIKTINLNPVQIRDAVTLKCCKSALDSQCQKWLTWLLPASVSIKNIYKLSNMSMKAGKWDLCVASICRCSFTVSSYVRWRRHEETRWNGDKTFFFGNETRRSRWNFISAKLQEVVCNRQHIPRKKVKAGQNFFMNCLDSSHPTQLKTQIINPA